MVGVKAGYGADVDILFMNRQSETLSQPALPRVLLFGATGAIGKSLCELLLANGWEVVAITRRTALELLPGVERRYGALPDVTLADESFDAIISCGPLDLFSFWYMQTEIKSSRVVAFSSTSVHVKQCSPEQAERDLAERLRQSEARLVDAANTKKAALTILRPTLIYGSGMDRNVSRIAAIALRFGFFVLPHNAIGLRQPVHVADLAQVTIAALQSVVVQTRSYDLPGGEILSYREMTRRVLVGIQPPARLLIVPGIFFNIVANAARFLRVHDAGTAVLARLRENLVFDDSAARSDLGYDPRPFKVDISILNVTR